MFFLSVSISLTDELNIFFRCDQSGVRKKIDLDLHIQKKARFAFKIAKPLFKWLFQIKSFYTCILINWDILAISESFNHEFIQ